MGYRAQVYISHFISSFGHLSAIGLVGRPGFSFVLGTTTGAAQLRRLSAALLKRLRLHRMNSMNCSLRVLGLNLVRMHLLSSCVLLHDAKLLQVGWRMD